MTEKVIEKLVEGVPFIVEMSRYTTNRLKWTSSDSQYCHHFHINDQYNGWPEKPEVNWREPFDRYAVINQIRIFVPDKEPWKLGHTLFEKINPPYIELVDSSRVHLDLCNQQIIACSYGMAKRGPMHVRWYPYESVDVNVYSAFPKLAIVQLHAQWYLKVKEDKPCA